MQNESNLEGFKGKNTPFSLGIGLVITLLTFGLIDLGSSRNTKQATPAAEPAKPNTPPSIPPATTTLKKVSFTTKAPEPRPYIEVAKTSKDKTPNFR